MKTIMITTQMMIFIPIITSLLVYVFNRVKFNYIIFIAQGVMSILLFKIWQYLVADGVITYTLGGWSKAIGIELKVDNLTFLFLLMAVIIWWVIPIYAWSQKKSDFKFLFFLLFLEGCFIAFVMVNDFFTFFVLIEIITILSSILILYKKDGISLKAGLYYLLFNSFGMIIYLIGLALLYLKVGTLNMSIIKEILASSDFITLNHSTIQVSFVCFFVSMCVKAALLPAYDWLPRAHTAAPAYISALLSGLLVKSGVFGLVRIFDVFQVEEIYQLTFYLGFFTAVSGFLFAISQKDIKGILAFHTISQIGLIIMSLSTATEIGLFATYLHLFNHFIFKSLLFLGAGVIINEYGVRRVTEIRGIAIAHPLLTLCMAIAIFSITGAPLFIGFISKTMIKMSMLTETAKWMMQVISVGTLISFIKFSKIFIGEPSKKKKIHPIQITGIVILAVICVIAFLTELKLLPMFIRINSHPSVQMLDHIKYIELASYSNKYLLEYFAMVFISYLIYKIFVWPNSKFWHAIRHFKMSFQNAVVALLVFIIVVFNYL